MLVVAALDRLAVSPEELDDLAPTLIDHEVRLDVGGVSFDPANRDGRGIFDSYILAMTR